jgi:hypothetical protein
MVDLLPDFLPEHESRGESRQRERLPNGYKPMVVPGVMFDPRLCFDLALRLDRPEDIFKRYGYDESGMLDLAKNPLFQRMLKAYIDDVEENGITYRAKARIAAEALLTQAYEIATDAEAP